MSGMQKTIGRDDLGRQQSAAVRRDLARTARDGRAPQVARVDKTELLSRMKAVQAERMAAVPDWVPAFLVRPLRIEMAGEA